MQCFVLVVLVCVAGRTTAIPTEANQATHIFSTQPLQPQAQPVITQLQQTTTTETPVQAQDNAVLTYDPNVIQLRDPTEGDHTSFLPMPITIDSMVVGGLCVGSCKPSTARSVSSWTWTTTLTTPLRYVLFATPHNKNIVSSVDIRTSSLKTSAFRGIIPLENPIANVTLGAVYKDITIEAVCRSEGETAVHIEVHDLADVFFPAHFFVMLSCPDQELSSGCQDIDCGAYGVCINGRCNCVEGHSGAFCGTSTFDECPRKCTGHGLGCDNGVCVCARGYGGTDCGRATGCRDLAFCSGKGECMDGAYCACEDGWTGVTCGEGVGSDHSCERHRHCSGQGLCAEQHSGEYACECAVGFTGHDCSVVMPLCPASCSGKGKCVDGGRCECSFGFKGDDCSQAYSPCDGCVHGECVERASDASPHCECHSGWAGPHCNTYDYATDVSRVKGYCSGQGLYNWDSRECSCFSGFGGSDCSHVVARGCVGNCNGNGKCDATTDTCKCNVGWSGEGCTVASCPASEGVLCSGHGACVSSNTGLACLCGSGFFGSSCSQTVCHHNTTCHGHGKCIKSSGYWNNLCECHEGWEGHHCEKPSSAHHQHHQHHQHQQHLAAAHVQTHRDVTHTTTTTTTTTTAAAVVSAAQPVKQTPQINNVNNKHNGDDVSNAKVAMAKAAIAA